MTREEQIKKAAQAYAFHAETAEVSRFTHCSRGFQEGIKWADANRWVKVEDGLPDVNRLCLVCIKEGEMEEEEFELDSAMNRAAGGVSFKYKNVTHWQYIEPPKAEQ